MSRLNSLLKQIFQQAVFQLALSQHMPAKDYEHQALGVFDVRASHPWLALAVY